MRGGRRFAMAILGAGLALGPQAAPAQNTDGQANSQPADTVGPRELQNFSLSGSVTKPADQPAPQPSAAAPAAPSSDTPAPARPARRSQPAAQLASKAPAASSPRPQRSVAAPSQAALSVASPQLPSLAAPVVPEKAVAPSVPTTSPAPTAIPTSTALPVAAGSGLLLWPWLLALLALAAGIATLFWRNRQRHAFAGGPDVNLFVAPEPAPAPPAPPAPPKPTAAPAPAPRPSPPPAAPKPTVGGVVSSRLRPSIELAIQPSRCIVEDHQVRVEFELELFNSGNAPARAVLVEAALFNAGPAQDQEIGAFMDQPVGAGERLDTILPLQRMSLRSEVIAPRETIQVFEVGGRQVFVPLIAFNALYGWSSREGQTSVSYLLGRETKAEKLAPFRLDLGPRVFRGLGARPLPLGVRK